MDVFSQSNKCLEFILLLQSRAKFQQTTFIDEKTAILLAYCTNTEEVISLRIIDLCCNNNLDLTDYFNNLVYLCILGLKGDKTTKLNFIVFYLKFV